MTYQRQPRRSRQQWQQIIHDLAQSGLSAKDFSQQQNLPYQSLIKWKHEFKHSSQTQTSPFLDITPKPTAIALSESSILWCNTYYEHRCSTLKV